MSARVVGVGMMCAGLVNGLTACGGSTSSESQPTSSIVTTAASLADQCHAKQWPIALPDWRGQRFDSAIQGDSACFHVTTATAPDGHNVLFDSGDAPTYFVVDQTPAPGTAVTERQPITVKLALTQAG